MAFRQETHLSSASSQTLLLVAIIFIAMIFVIGGFFMLAHNVFHALALSFGQTDIDVDVGLQMVSETLLPALAVSVLMFLLALRLRLVSLPSQSRGHNTWQMDWAIDTCGPGAPPAFDNSIIAT